MVGNMPTWEPPSDHVAQLIRAGAAALLDEPAALFDQVDAAVLEATPPRLADDPAITAATVATNHANILHWATANQRRPGAQVPPNLSPAVLDLARDIVRRSHLHALATQRLMHRMPGDLRLASYEDVQLVALSAQDEEGTAEFVARTLGRLATADPELRETLRVYVREEFSASRAARALFAHRNTVLNRLTRARELLPAPLEGRGLQVGLALEIVHWLGPSALRP
jgi:DNA-binding PucR family transcriptional regulator